MVENFNEAKGDDFKPTDDTVMIKIGGYPWYFKKIDSTHFSMGNNPESIEGNFATASHIGQHRSEDYHDSLKSWLKQGGISSKELNGKEFKGNG